MTQIKKQNFDALAAHWDEDPARVRRSASIADAIRSRASVTEQTDVLDFGCGTGLIALNLAPHARRIVGLDSSAGMLERLSAKTAAGGIFNVEGRLFNLDQGDELLEKFHLIVSVMALHHIPDTLGLFRKWHEWLHPGGAVALVDLDKEPGTFHSDNTGVFHFGFDRTELKDALADTGFKHINIDFEILSPVVKVHDDVSRAYPAFLATAEKA